MVGAGYFFKKDSSFALKNKPAPATQARSGAENAEQALGGDAIERNARRFSLASHAQLRTCKARRLRACESRVGRQGIN